MDMQRPVYLSHSASTRYEVCPEQYRLMYQERWTAEATSLNFGYGGAADEAMSAFIVAHALGHGDEVDMPAIFEAYFRQFDEEHAVAYNSRFPDMDAVLASGKLLVARYKEDYLKRGYVAALDPEGKPIVQRKLRVKLPGNVYYTAILDTILITPQFEVVIVDNKTASNEAPEDFHETAGQLTGQQLVVEAHKEELGIDHIDGLMFYQAIKKAVPKSSRGTGPVMAEPHQVRPRTKEELDAYVESRLWIAEDIRRGRFPKRPLDAYNSPCAMCDFASLCIYGQTEGLKKRNAYHSHSKKPQPQTGQAQVETTGAVAA